MSVLNRLRDLFADRWQIPLALIATVVGGVTLYRFVPTPPPREYDALVADVTLLEESGELESAADAVANLLELEPPLPRAQRAELHDRFAQLVYEFESDRTTHNLTNVRNLMASQQAAWDLGRPHTPASQLRMGMAHHWLGQSKLALRTLREVVGEELLPDQRRQAERAVVELLDRNPKAQLERRQLLEDLLVDPRISDAHLWWCLQRAVEDALNERDSRRARQLLETHAPRFSTSDLKGYLEYLNALVHVYEGESFKAEPIVHWIDDWLGSAARTPQELDQYGYLPNMNRWLMGRVHLMQHRPQEALSAFDDVLSAEPEPELMTAAAVGKGAALAALGRHNDALVAFKNAVSDTESHPQVRRSALATLRESLLELHRDRQAAADHPNALAYLQLAVDLTPAGETDALIALHEQLGDAYRQAALATADAEMDRAYWSGAAENYEHAADLVKYDEPHTVELLWSASDAYDRAGRIGSLRRVLEQFVRGRADDPRMPQALLKLGQACEALGDFRAALTTYDELIDRYPKLQEAIRAQVLKAGVCIALGEDRYRAAEEILTGLLEGDDIGPDAPAFRDALLALCELLYHERRYGEAISRLGDFLTLYPEDPERVRAHFMVADAYRRSAHDLLASVAEGEAGADVEATGRERLRQAADLFAQLLQDAEDTETRDEALALYTRLALFYRGDCLFELNEPQSLEEALATYRNAAARYAGQPGALAAHVQIANIQLQRGNVIEAARAVEKARWLLRSIPKGSFTRAGAGDRDEWERFLSVVSSSDLFRGVFISPQ